MYRIHEYKIKPKRPLFSDYLSNAAKIPIIISTALVTNKQPDADETETDDEIDEFFDAPDHFSDDDDEQAPEEDITDLIIKFKPLTVWNNSEDNEVEYILPPNYGKFNFNYLFFI